MSSRSAVSALISFVFLSSTMAIADSSGGDRYAGMPHASRSPVMATHGVVATTEALASQAAADILKAGGNAVDAAIAANAMVCLISPMMCGIGGDLFAIVWDPKTQRLHGLNASGRSSGSVTREAMIKRLGPDANHLPLFGPLAVSIPGAVDGWFMLHERFGKLPMGRILAPAIRYAREGVPISVVTAWFYQTGLEGLRGRRAEVVALDNLEKMIAGFGATPQAGEIYRNPDLARSYELIAEGGRDAFYKGAIAASISDFLASHGGVLTREDFAAHHGEWVEPVSANYRGFDVFELPPNGQGIAALQMLRIMEGYDIAAMGHNTADQLHVFIEAKKLAYEDRARYYADPHFYDVPIDALLSDAHTLERRGKIRMELAMTEIEPDPAMLENGDTTYLTAADENGMMVSLIQSNYASFGSGLVPDGLGFVLQNRGASFNLDPNHPNAYAPAKRPFHTIIPGFLMKDGQPLMSFGVLGGAMQPQGHVQILSNMIDFGMNVQEAGDAARARHLGSSQPDGAYMTDGGQVFIESAVSREVRAELIKRGHHLVDGPSMFGMYQAIWRDPVSGVYSAGSDKRVDGAAVGY